MRKHEGTGRQTGETPETVRDHPKDDSGAGGTTPKGYPWSSFDEAFDLLSPPLPPVI